MPALLKPDRILSPAPAGALVDRLRSKRGSMGAGIVALATGSLPIAFVPTFWSVMLARVPIGATSSIFGAAICAISLGIAGYSSCRRLAYKQFPNPTL